MSRSTALALLLTLTCSAPVRSAWGAEVAIVGAHVQTWDEDGNLAAAQQLADALAATGRLDPIPPADVRARLAGRESLVLQDAFLGPGQTAFNEGRVLYQRAEFEDAMTSLATAVELLREGLPVATDNRSLIDALLLQGLTHFSIGDNDPARAAFEELVVLDPSRRLDPVNYSQPTVDFFEEVRDSVMARGIGGLRVMAPDDAEVYVDARLRGTGEITLSDLPVGSHSVLVLAGGGVRDFQRVDVSAGKTDKLSVDPTRGLHIDAARDDAGRSRQTGLLYEALGRYADTSLVLLAGETSAGELQVQLLDTRTGTWSDPLPAGTGDPAMGLLGTAERVADLLDDAGNVAADHVSPRALPLSLDDNALLLDLLLDPEPLQADVTDPTLVEDDKRGVPWWVWAGGGVLVAGGGTTAAVLLTQDSGATSTGTVIVGPMP